MAGLLGELFVRIAGDDGPLQGTLRGVKSSLLGLGAVGARAGGSIAGGLASGLGVAVAGVGVAGLGVLIGKAIHGASDLNETLSKTGVIFGDSSKTVVAGADAAAASLGIVRTEYLDMAANFGGLLQGMAGQTKEESAKMAMDLNKVADDASSMFNNGFAEAASKMAAALRGESEPLRSLNVNINEAATAQEAVRLGLAKTTKAVTDQQKVMARMSLVTKGLKVAAGDHAATMGGFANSSRGAWGRISNMLTTFGQAIMPVVESFLGGLNKMLAGLDAWVVRSKPMFTSWAENVKSAFQTVSWVFGQLVEGITATGSRITTEVGTWTQTTTAVAGAWTWLKRQASDVFESLGIIFRNWSTIGEIMGVIVMEKMTNIGEAFMWLLGVAGTLGTYLANNWVELIRDAVAGAWSLLSNLAINIGELFRAAWDAINGNGFHPNFAPLLDGFKIASAKFPEIARPAFTSMAKDLEVLQDKLNGSAVKRINDNAAAARGGAAAPEAAAARPAQGPADKPMDAKTDKVKTTDLAGFSKLLQEGLFKGKDTVALRTAVAAEATAKNTAKVAAQEIKPAGPALAG